jgi:nucleoside-diphosphate-sugar epimerase
MTTPSRVLVTGVSGFIGSAVARRLVRRGVTVSALVRPGSSLDRLGPLAAQVERVEADLRDAGSLRAAAAVARPDVCLHLAAGGVLDKQATVAQLAAVNVGGSLALVDALAAAGCTRIVNAGSSFEYGSLEGVADEGLSGSPKDAYGASKLAQGALVHAAGRALGVETVHLRAFQVYGPGEAPGRLVPSLAASLLARTPLDLTEGRQVRDFVFVEDVVDAFMAAAERPEAAGATINVGSGVPTSVRELCLGLADATGADRALLRFGALPYRANEGMGLYASTALAEELLGFRAATTLGEGLARTAEAVARAAEQPAAA